jgi:hypothetical protein
MTAEVNNSLRRRGVVIPVENTDGSVSIGRYAVIKTPDRFYSIIDYRGHLVADKINLPQTAAVLANGLALGRFLDAKLLQLDRQYGYALFEELLYQNTVKNSSKKSLETYEISMTKYLIAQRKKEQHKGEIIRSFEKLKNLT